MFQSPLKTVAEKIKPTDSQSSISSLKFDRSSDFKKFINFIKNETEQLEKIKLPSATEVKPKSKLPGALGLLGLGFFGILSAAFGGKGDGGKDDKFRIGGTEASGIPSVPSVGLGSIIRKNPIKLATKEGLGKDAEGKSRIRTTKYEERRQKLRIKKNILRKKFREQRIDDQITKNNKAFLNEFERLRKQRIKNARIQLGLELFSEEELPDFEVQKILDQDKGKFPGQMDQELANKIKARFAKKGRFFIDSGDPVARKQVSSRIGFFDLLKKIEEPITLEDAQLMENLRDNVGGATSGMSNEQKLLSMRAAAEAEELLNQPEFKTLLKEDKFQKITGTNTPKARSFFGGKFTPKYALDDFFTGVGKKTKGFRDFMSRPFMKGQKPTGLTKALMPAAKFGGNIFRVGGFGFDLVSAISQLAKIVDGFIVGDNILTAYYDLGVAVHNVFHPDKTKQMFFITRSRDPRLNAYKDKKNQEILESINKAKAAKGINNQVSAQEGSSGIIPFAKGMVSTPFGITLSPTIYTWKLVTEKLYKQ